VGLSDLTFGVGITYDQAESGLKTLVTHVDGASAEMRNSLDSIGPGAGEASEGIEKLARSLKHWRAEVVQQGRFARFLANDIAELGIPIDGVTAGFGKMVAAFAFGGSIVEVGLETLKFTIGRIKDAIENVEGHEKKAREELDKYAKESIKSIDQLREKLDALALSQRGANEFEIQAHNELAPKMNEHIKLIGETIIAERNLEAQYEAEKSNEFEVYAATNAHDIVEIKTKKEKAEVLQKEIDLKRAELNINERDVALQAEQNLSPGAATNDSAKRRKDQNERLNERRTFAAQALSLERQFLGDIEVINRESKNRIAAIEAQYREKITAEDRAQKARLIADEQRLAQRRVELSQWAHDQIRAQAETDFQKTQAQNTEALVTEEKAVTALQMQMEDERYGVQFAQGAAAIRKRTEDDMMVVRQALNHHLISAEDAQKLLTQIQRKGATERGQLLLRERGNWIRDFAQPVEAAVSTMFRSMILHGTNATEALRTMLLSLADAAISGVIKVLAQKITSAIAELAVDTTKATAEVAKNAAVAGSAVAAATAGYALFGAVGLGEAMQASVLGAFMPVAAAAGGADIPAGADPVMQLHQKEMVLPANIADPLRASLAVGGIGGDVHIHVHGDVYDAGGVRALPRNPDFIRAVRDAMREGRWP
jgi:hypothetical protein